MYEFPPPIWSMQDWSFGGLGLCILATVAVVLLSRRTQATFSHIMAWLIAVVTSLVWLNESLSGRYITYAPHRYLMFCPLVIVIGGLARLVRFFFTTARPLLMEATAYVTILLMSAALVWPLQRADDVSPRTRCKNNLKQLAIAAHNYHDEQGRFPPATLGLVPVSWRVTLLPWIEKQNVFERYERIATWDSETNRPLQKAKITEYACPSRPDSYSAQGQFLTSYVAPVGSGTVFGSATGTSLSEIADGSSSTLLFLETCGTAIVWTEPRDIDVDTSTIGINLPGSQFGTSESILSSWHYGGSEAALADGSVRFFQSDTDPTVLKSMLTRNGAEKVSE